jgi:60 kDa SS-A/Ro ribonucleoprotein
MAHYLKRFALPAAQTPQNQPIPGTAQVPNSAGGYAWEASAWDQLKRFLILGSEGGSYYATEAALTVENANHVLACIQDDGLRVVRETVAISETGRAPKNDPAIFVLALARSATRRPGARR